MVVTLPSFFGFPREERDQKEGAQTVDPPRVHEELHNKPDRHDRREIATGDGFDRIGPERATSQRGPGLNPTPDYGAGVTIVTWPVAILYTPPTIASVLFSISPAKGSVVLSRLTWITTFAVIGSGGWPIAGQIFWVIAFLDPDTPSSPQTPRRNGYGRGLKSDLPREYDRPRTPNFGT